MELRINDYVRTKDGIIDKVIIDYNGHCANPECNCKHVSCVYNYYDEDTIVKSSPSIIDLIEVGDYVNGYQVLNIYNYKNCDSHLLVNGIGCNVIMQEDIKSIVTHEEFESMEYKL